MLILTRFLFFIQIRADNDPDLMATSGLSTAKSATTATRELGTTETTTVTATVSQTAPSTSFSTTGTTLYETGLFFNPRTTLKKHKFKVVNFAKNIQRIPSKWDGLNFTKNLGGILKSPSLRVSAVSLREIVAF